jgi:DNA-binding NarL/FixJ family response regulator
MIDKLLLIKLNKISLKHRKRTLTDLEVKILERIKDDKTYYQIAEEINYAETYISDQVRKICQILSKELNTRVTKTNLFTALDLMDSEYKLMLVLPAKERPPLMLDSQ